MTNYIYIIDTNSIVSALGTVIAGPQCQSSFNSGLYLGSTIVAALFGFSFLRTITGDNHEDI